VENNFFTALTGQSIHEDLVKKSGLRRILCDKSCLRRILFHNKSGLRRILFIKNPLLNHSGMHFFSSFLFCLANSLLRLLGAHALRGPRLPDAHALRRILTETVFERSASVDMIQVLAGVTVTMESKQQAWTKQSLSQRYLCVGCQLKSDQAIRSLCLKEHVKARGSTL